MESEPALSAATLEEMSRFGIVRVTEDHYYHGGYHYLSLADAIAQASRGQSAPDPETAPDELMAQYGIVRRSADCFHYGNFRYGSLRDALAQARHHPSSKR